MSEPTPRPWQVEEQHQGYLISKVSDDVYERTPIATLFIEEDARLIVRAVNCHDALVEALLDVVTQYPLIHPGIEPAWIRNARAALANATEE